MQYQSLGQAYKQMRELKEGYTPARVKTTITTFVVALLLQLAFVVMAIWCLFQCNSLGKIPSWALLLIILVLLIPDVGLLVSVIVIVYYFLSCKASGAS